MKISASASCVAQKDTAIALTVTNPVIVSTKMSVAACAVISVEEAEKIFFSESATKQAKAKAFCNSCEMSAACLQMALDNRIEYGIFGGMTADEREAMLDEINSCFTNSGTQA